MGFGRKTNNPNTQKFVWAFAITDHIEGSCTDLRSKKKKKPVTYCAINIYKDLIRNDQAVLYSYLISQTVSLGSSGDLDFLFQLN
jgi:hypothetical protein